MLLLLISLFTGLNLANSIFQVSQGRADLAAFAAFSAGFSGFRMLEMCGQ